MVTGAPAGPFDGPWAETSTFGGPYAGRTTST